MSHFSAQRDKAVEHRQYIEELLLPMSMSSIQLVHRLVTEAIDPKESAATQSVYIRPGYDEQLDRERELFDNLEGELTAAAHRVLEQVPLLQHVSVEYVPQIGYLVAVRSAEVHLLGTASGSVRARSMAPQSFNSGHRVREGTDEDGRFDASARPDTSASMRVRASRGQSTAATAGTSYGNQQSSDPYDHSFDPQALDEWDCPGSRDTRAGSRHMYAQQDRPEEGMSYQPHAESAVSDTTGSQFQFVYSQDEIHYFKHAIVYELDDSIGDIKSLIVDHQNQLLLKLEDDILDHEPAIQQAALMLANLDALISLGTIAFELKLTRPQIVEENVIVIKNGRHPLQELTVDCFVPNDTFLTDTKNIALITGPNSSGKSVYLKQVGLMVYLAHLGSWLPCDNAAIGLTDKIFTRIASLESNLNQFSSFSLDLNQVSKMLSHHTPRSLCLIDEFGKGTSPVDGIALLATVINHFAEKKAKAVFVLHFTEALHPSVLTPAATACVSTFRMDTYSRPIEDFEIDELNTREEVLAQRGQSDGRGVTNGTGTGPDGSLTGFGAYDPTPLFKLKVGVSPSSEGIPCARMAGIPESILARAAAIKHCVSTKQAIHPVPTQRANILSNVNVRRLVSIFLLVKDWTVVLYNRLTGASGAAGVDGQGVAANSTIAGEIATAGHTIVPPVQNNPTSHPLTTQVAESATAGFSLLQELKQLIRSHI